MSQVGPGSVVWAQFGATAGREQKGARPAVVIASRDYLAAVPDLVIVMPATTRDRRWPHHIRLTGSQLDLPKPSWAMTEQPRAISRSRLGADAGRIDDRCMRQLMHWLDDFLHPPTPSAPRGPRPRR
jgi:mRNA interferase MazF